MKTLTMIGQPCPIPVIQAKKELALDTSDGVIVLVDNIVAVQNLEKMARGLGYTCSYKENENSRFSVSIIKTSSTIINKTSSTQSACEIPEPSDKTNVSNALGSTILITDEHMGRGSDELGKILIKGFIFSLTELSPIPHAVLFLNAGVKLLVEGANTVQDLKTLEQKGTKILACGTCLNYYQLTEKLAVGNVTDMFGISSMINAATRVITV